MEFDIQCFVLLYNRNSRRLTSQFVCVSSAIVEETQSNRTTLIKRFFKRTKTLVYEINYAPFL